MRYGRTAVELEDCWRHRGCLSRLPWTRRGAGLRRRPWKTRRFPETVAIVKALCDVEPAFRELRAALPQLLVESDSLSLPALGEVLEGLRDIGRINGCRT